MAQLVSYLFDSLAPLWPMWVVFGMAGLLFFAYKTRRLFWLARSGIPEIDRMNDEEFEERLSLLFFHLGYADERTTKLGWRKTDWGVDIVLKRDGIRTALQAKHRSRGRVGVHAVQEVVAGKAMHDCSGAMVVTNRSYTPEALKLAKANHVVMYDRGNLVEMLARAKRSKPLTAPAAPPVTVRATAAACFECNSIVSERVRAYCLENTRRFGGRVYCMQHQGTAALQS